MTLTDQLTDQARPRHPAAMSLGRRHSLLLVTEARVNGQILADRLAAGGRIDARVQSAAEAAACLLSPAPDLVVIDVCGVAMGDPPRLGAGLVTSLRSDYPDAWLLAAAPVGDPRVVKVLDWGADDHLPLPVDVGLFRARVRARQRCLDEGARTRQRTVVDELAIDPTSRRCHVGTHEVTLRAKQFDLLAMLAAHEGEMVPRSRLISELWDEHWAGSTKSLDVTMVGLRRQLREEASRWGALVPDIATIRGRGYRLESRAARRHSAAG